MCTKLMTFYQSGSWLFSYWASGQDFIHKTKSDIDISLYTYWVSFRTFVKGDAKATIADLRGDEDYRRTGFNCVI